LLGAFLRIADAAILAVVTLNGLVTLRLLTDVGYAQAFEPGQLQGLARLFVGARGLGFYIGFVFLGLGSAVFAYLLFKSRYVPRALPAWGMFASLLLALPVHQRLSLLEPRFCRETLGQDVHVAGTAGRIVVSVLGPRTAAIPRLPI
jgi:Domain of unknown function (DUF4386)